MIPANKKNLLKRPAVVIPTALLILGIVLANFAAWQKRVENQAQLQQLFEAEAIKMVDSVGFHTAGYKNSLLGTRGMIVAYGIDAVSRRAFKNYAASRNIDIEFPGVIGIGFVRRVFPENLAEFLHKARQDDMPDFAVKEFAPHQGEKYIIQYVEPVERNRKAIGLDMASETIRRNAAQQAMQSGLPTMTPPVTLVQASGLPLQACLLILPVYDLAKPLDTIQQREVATLGWIYTAVLVNDLLNQIDLFSGQLALQITDISPGEKAQVFYSSPEFKQAFPGQHNTKITRVIFGRTWQFDLQATPSFYQKNQQLSPIWYSSMIVLISIFLSTGLYIYLKNRQRIFDIAVARGRLAAIVESSNDAIIGLDLNGIITSWNHGAITMFGFSDAEAMGRTTAELIVPAELSCEDEMFLKKIQTGDFVANFVTKRKTKDGNLIDISLTISPIRNEYGKLVGTAKTLRDITKLKRSQEMFKLVIEAMPDAVITVNDANLITLLNQSAVKLTGYEKEELLGKNISQLIPARYREMHGEHIKQFHLHRDSRPMGRANQNLWILHKNGSEIPVEIQLSPIQTHDEKFTLTLISDIRLRKELQAELKNSLARMKMALDLRGMGVWVWQPEKNATLWDERMFELYDVPREGLTEKCVSYDLWRSRIHPDDIDQVEQNIQQSLIKKQIFASEFRVILRNGEIRYLKSSAMIERDAQNNAVQLVGINYDISARKQKEAQIKELNEKRTAELQEINASLEHQVEIRTAELNEALIMAKQAGNAKTEFLANMSHEIRTPMNAILGIAYLLQKKSLSPEAQGMVNKIDLAGRSLLGIINSCLDFSKIENNLLTLEQIPFQLSDVFDNLANIMSAAAGAKNIELLITSIPKEANYLTGDPTRLGQVLINLAGNALKFTSQGEVIVSVKILGQDLQNRQVRLKFSVTDTGIGIPPEKQETIFQPFLQADTSTTRVYGGTGLGLSISRHLVALMGGELQLHSEVGVGSEFFFELTLPVNDVARNATPEIVHQKVLIVDDNQTACMILEAMVQSLGWSSCVVDSGEKALQTLQERGAGYFDLFLIDWKMPELDGLQTAVEIKTQLGEYHPLIIMVTAYDRVALLESPSIEVVDAVVSKPVTASNLFDAVLEVKAKKGEIEFDDSRGVDGERLKGLKILVVDDNETNREVAHQILGGEGATVETAENGQEAIVRLMVTPDYFDIVLMDVQMPVMDGYTATRKIRGTEVLKHLPVIALTAGAFKSQRDAALDAGMDDFVGKPFDIDKLVACVEKWTGGNSKTKSNSAVVSETSVLPTPLDFSNHPLIDVTQGLKIWRDEQIYKKSLHNFAQRYEQDAAQTQQALLNNNLEIAKPLTHKLLGSAGALSLKRLTRILSELEATFNSGGNAQQHLAQFTEISSQTLDALKTYVGAETRERNDFVENLDKAICSQEELTALTVALDSDDPHLVEIKLSALKGKLPKQQFDRLANAIDNFDFRSAENIVHALSAELFNSDR